MYGSLSDIPSILWCPFPIMWQGPITDWSDPNRELPLERTVFGNRGRGGPQGRVSYTCHHQLLLSLQWHLNLKRAHATGDRASGFFLFSHTSEKISSEACWACCCAHQQNNDAINTQISELAMFMKLPRPSAIMQCTRQLICISNLEGEFVVQNDLRHKEHSSINSPRLIML